MKLTDDAAPARRSRVLYAELDPAPADLADGVLARLAVEDLETEYELLTLVERSTTPGRARAQGTDEARDERDGRARVRRYVVPRPGAHQHASTARAGSTGGSSPRVPMRVFLGPQGDALAHTRQSAYADREGRFEFPTPVRGEVRLWLLPQTARGDGDAVAPFVTPAFLV